jgi:hypothetical protein
MLFPAITGVGVDTVLNARSAWPAVATTSVAVAEFAPKAWFVEFTVTVSGITVPLAVPAVTFTTSVTVPLVPDGADAPVQLIRPVPPTAGVVHVVPVGAVSDTNVVSTGVFSLNVGAVAAALPTFVAVCV